MSDAPPPSPTPTTPDPLDPIIADMDNLTINRAITTAPSQIGTAVWPMLIEAIRRDRARFNIAEAKRDAKRSGDEEITDPSLLLATDS